MRDMDKEALDMLRNIGLNQYESRIYLALLQSGAMSASELSDNADIPRPRTYDVLDKLSKQGFVSIQPGRPTRFSALGLNEAVKNLKKVKQDDMERSFEGMERLKERLASRLENIGANVSTNPSDMVWILKERGNIYSKMEELLQNATESVIISSTDDGLKRKIGDYEHLLRDAKGRGADIRIISPVKDHSHAHRVRDIAHVRHSEGHHRVIIADDEALLFLTPDDDEKAEVAAWIRSPYFTENLRKGLE